MSRVDVQWFGEARLAEIVKAADLALAATAEVVTREVRKTLSRTTGGVAGQRNGRNIYRASAPGTPPGWRTGTLARSIVSGKSGFLRYKIGTNLEYARIHELGGTINHPGGTFYTIGPNGAVFLGADKAAQVRQRGGFVGRTRPHPITMPPRPFLVPTLRRLEADGTIQRRFSQRFKANMKGNA